MYYRADRPLMYDLCKGFMLATLIYLLLLKLYCNCAEAVTTVTVLRLKGHKPNSPMTKLMYLSIFERTMELEF
jgi:hypothetical protein